MKKFMYSILILFIYYSNASAEFDPFPNDNSRFSANMISDITFHASKCLGLEMTINSSLLWRVMLKQAEPQIMNEAAIRNYILDRVQTKLITQPEPSGGWCKRGLEAFGQSGYVMPDMLGVKGR